MYGYPAGMNHNRCSGFQNVFAHLAQTPALEGDVLHQHPQAVYELVGVQAQQHADLIAPHHLLHGRSTVSALKSASFNSSYPVSH